MWLILQQPEPDDFVIATGEYHTVCEFCTLAFSEVGIELEWRGNGIDEKGYDKATGRKLIEVDPVRKLTNVDELHSLGWHHHVDSQQGVNMLYDWYLASCEYLPSNYS